jgi:hypothetical protein
MIYQTFARTITDRHSETRNAADTRNVVNTHPFLIIAKGCSGRLANDNITPVIEFAGDSVFVLSLIMMANMAALMAATVDKGASQGGGRRQTAVMPAIIAITIDAKRRFIRL